MGTDEKTLAAARKAVRAIVADIEDRRGLKWEWQNIDYDVRKEIKQEWERIIVAAMSAGKP